MIVRHLGAADSQIRIDLLRIGSSSLVQPREGSDCGTTRERDIDGSGERQHVHDDENINPRLKPPRAHESPLESSAKATCVKNAAVTLPRRPNCLPLRPSISCASVAQPT